MKINISIVNRSLTSNFKYNLTKILFDAFFKHFHYFPQLLNEKPGTAQTSNRAHKYFP